MERIVEFEPAYDRRSADPKKNYGIHGVNIRFVLKGKEGAVQFLLYTNWQLPRVQKEFDQRTPDARFPYMFHEPMAADLGYHSLKPLYEDQTTMGPCQYLDGKDCYYDGSGMAAKKVFDILRAEGDAGVWKYLEDYYSATFAVNKEGAGRTNP